MLKLVIKKVHVTCIICITYMYTNTNQVLAQNFEPFSAHVKARPWCSSGWSEEWAVIWKWGLWASCTRLPMSDLMLWRLAAFVQYPGQCSICTTSWTILWFYNILPNTFFVQYTICCLIPNMLPNITQPLRPQNQRDPTHLLSKAQQGHPYKKKNILSLIWVLLNEL